MTKNVTLSELMAVSDQMLEKLVNDPEFIAMTEHCKSGPSSQTIQYLAQYAASFSITKTHSVGVVQLHTN